MTGPATQPVAMPADTDIVFVPAHPVRTEFGAEPYIEVARMPGSDERIGLAFTSVEALVTLLGEFQPWVSVQMYGFVGFLRSQGVRMLHIDAVQGEGMKRLSAEDRWSLGDVMRARRVQAQG